MKRRYHTIDNQGKHNEQELTRFLVKNGQILLPLVELIEQSRTAVDDLIDTVGRASVEAILMLSAGRVAGARTQGKRREGEVVWYGKQPGRVYLKERQLKVDRPRLRRRGQGAGGEVPIPAYEAMQDREGMGQRMLELLMRGISTRNYQEVIGTMAETAGVTRSSVSRETIREAEKAWEQLSERRWDGVDLLVIYLDGIVYAEHHVIGAVGVDTEGNKHVLGIQLGTTENEAAVKDLLERLVAQGVDPGKKRLFVIDGSKALRAGINAVFGRANYVQRCRQHKLRNVMDRVNKEDKDWVKASLRTAWRMDAKEGMKKLQELAGRLPVSASSSLLEGLEECFTINTLGLPVALRRCLCTTNVIESPHAGVRMRTRRVTNWRDEQMVGRWVANAFLATEKSFRRIMGHDHLWMLQEILRGKDETVVDSKKKIA